MDSPIAEKIQATIKQLEALPEPPAQTNTSPPTLEDRVAKLEGEMVARRFLEVGTQTELAKTMLRVLALEREINQAFLVMSSLAVEIKETRRNLNLVLDKITTLNKILENNPLFASGPKGVN